MVGGAPQSKRGEFVLAGNFSHGVWEGSDICMPRSSAAQDWGTGQQTLLQHHIERHLRYSKEQREMHLSQQGATVTHGTGTRKAAGQERSGKGGTRETATRENLEPACVIDNIFLGHLGSFGEAELPPSDVTGAGSNPRPE